MRSETIRRTFQVSDCSCVVFVISAKHGETMLNQDGMLVKEASKARKRALAGLQKIHEAMTRERKTIDLGPVRPSLNRSAHKTRLGGLRSRVDGSESGGQNKSGTKFNGPKLSGPDGQNDGSEYEVLTEPIEPRESHINLTQAGKSSVGPVFGPEQFRNFGENLRPASDGIAPSRSPQNLFPRIISLLDPF
ncbi:uncharacterized protein E5676_scaffold682G00020 [Cucumis melo var. makuwa]|uniref:Uncharacterized protein n=1 Tax=Cucumis melo var. makuwa TaxID=1194695 RepID=A0A5D3DB65_CUCMM|nr:uncharacterized protein E6C27_scaffold17G00020 [Cucumis melo var. makuwa]TYK20851.1 uncharacterized protein E5676_scaffold682G00020 [Cucumis melo var. makuwa]